MFRLTLPSFLLASVLLTGCAMQTASTGTTTIDGEISSGSVHGGQQPVSGAAISLYAVGTGTYGSGATLLASSTTNQNGQFNIPMFTCPSSSAPTYIVARGGSPQVAGTAVNPNLALASILGPCSSALANNIAINEVTTAATALTLGHFFTTTLGSSSTNSFGTSSTNLAGLTQATTVTYPMLVNGATGAAMAGGTVGGVTKTIDYAKLNSIANTIAACVNTTGVGGSSTNCANLFAYTTPPSVPATGYATPVAPTDTLQAAVQIALFPYQNVTQLYQLSSGTGAPFAGLGSAPNDWTIAASFTSTAYQLAIVGNSTSGTTTSLDIDQAGNVWFPTNSAASHGLAYFTPASGSFTGPYATRLAHPQYVAVDNQGNVWSGDFQSQGIIGIPYNSPSTTSYLFSTNGSVGAIAIDAGDSSANDAVLYVDGGNSTTPGNALYQLLMRSQTMITTYTKPVNTLFAYGSDVYPGVDAGTSGSSTVCSYETYEGSQGPNGVTASTAGSPCIVGGIAPAAEGNDGAIVTSTNQICNAGSNASGACFASPVTLNAPKNVALDGDSSLWVANSGSASISTLGNFVAKGSNKYAHTSADYVQTSTVPYLHGTGNGGTMTTPYGLVIDQAGNVWISNATCLTTAGTDCSTPGFTLSELIGAAAPTITPLASQNVNVTYSHRP